MSQKITLDALAIIDAIERRGSFAKAAEELNRATSALSYTVQKLEQQLGITLFERQGRNSILTAAGRLLLDEGRKILAASDWLTNKVKELAQGWEPVVRIAIESTTNRKAFFLGVEHFLTQHPGIELDIEESVLSGGWEALQYDRVDLLVGGPAPSPSHKGIRAVPISAPEMLLVAARHHPIVALKDKPEELASAIQQPRRIVTHDTARINVERSEGLLTGDEVIYVQTVDQKIAAQRAGLGIGHLARTTIQPWLDSGELVILSNKQNNINSFIAWKINNKGKALRTLSQQLIESMTS